MKKNDSKGLFITFEGGEGAGKSTLLAEAADFFKGRGCDVITTREPGGSPLGETIRDWLLQRNDAVKISPHAELLLFLASRAQHIDEVISPALQAGKVVLCDRFNDSTIAYQGYARGLGLDYVKNLCSQVCRDVVPNLTFYLRVDPETGLHRSKGTHKKQAASGELDRIESEKMDFHRSILEGFDLLAKQEPSRIFVIDAAKTKEYVIKKAMAKLEKTI